MQKRSEYFQEVLSIFVELVLLFGLYRVTLRKKFLNSAFLEVPKICEDIIKRVPSVLKRGMKIGIFVGKLSV